MSVLKQDNRGVSFPENTESAEFVKLLKSRKVFCSVPGMICSSV